MGIGIGSYSLINRKSPSQVKSRPVGVTATHKQHAAWPATYPQVALSIPLPGGSYQLAIIASYQDSYSDLDSQLQQSYSIAIAELWNSYSQLQLAIKASYSQLQLAIVIYHSDFTSGGGIVFNITMLADRFYLAPINTIQTDAKRQSQHGVCMGHVRIIHKMAVTSRL